MEAVIDRRDSDREADLASIERLRDELNAALRGKADVVELVLACLLAKGHLLLEDLPGLGKTTLAKALAHAVGGCYSRVQCTPDLMPSDITGFNLLNQKTREFEFSEGPVFTDVLLADEINRATPRTQSALFESMAERQVTIDRVPPLVARNVFRHRDPKPGREPRRLPTPRSPARQLRDEAVDRLPRSRERVGRCFGTTPPSGFVSHPQRRARPGQAHRVAAKGVSDRDQ